MNCTTNSKCICCKSSSDSLSESLREEFRIFQTMKPQHRPLVKCLNLAINTYFSVEYTGCFTNINDKNVDMEVENYGSIVVT